jgi:replicative DNA helicase
VPPQNLEAEESVLGAMMLSAGAIDAVSEILDPADFYRHTHAVIYTAALALYGKGEAVDAITLADELDERGELDGAGGKEKIHELAAAMPAAANAGHYARIVKEMAQLRGLIRHGGEAQRLGFDRPGEVAELIDRVQQDAYELTPGLRGSATEHISGAVLEAFQRVEMLAKRGSEVIGVASGFRSLDRITLGFEPGNLIIVAARPSMGKSALATGITANVAIRQGIPVGVFTMEMSRAEITQRLLAAEGNIDSQHLRSGRGLSPDEWSRLAAASDTVSKAPIFVDDQAALTLTELRSKLRKLKSRQPVGLVIVDYLGLMRVPDVKQENRTVIVSIITAGLKALARDFEVPIIALSQLNRNLEGRLDKRPTLADLRDSGSVEQDADIVVFLYRDDYYNKESETPGVTEVNIAKQRNGPTDTIELYFNKTHSKFTELQR